MQVELGRLPDFLRCFLALTLEAVSQINSDNGSDIKAYLIGGLVRDLLLSEIDSKLSFNWDEADVDLMFSPEHESLLKFFSNTSKLGSLKSNENLQLKYRKVEKFKKYRTAKVYFDDFPLEFIDISGARSDSYSSSGALPKISPGNLKEDLARRDFSINALAFDLAGSKLVDFFSGVEDLRLRQLRVLHERSYFDDPARLIRAARFKARLGLSYSKKDLELVREALEEKYLDNLPRPRLASELTKASFEADFWSCLDTPEVSAGIRSLCFDKTFIAGCLNRAKRNPVEAREFFRREVKKASV